MLREGASLNELITLQFVVIIFNKNNIMSFIIKGIYKKVSYTNNLQNSHT